MKMASYARRALVSLGPRAWRARRRTSGGARAAAVTVGAVDSLPVCRSRSHGGLDGAAVGRRLRYGYADPLYRRGRAAPACGSSKASPTSPCTPRSRSFPRRCTGLRAEELALGRAIQDVHDEINILVPRVGVGRHHPLEQREHEAAVASRAKAKPAVAVSPAVREMTGFTNVTELNVSLYLSLEELDALDVGLIPTVAQMVLDTHGLQATAVETAIAMACTRRVYPTNGSDEEGEYFDGGVSSGQQRELLFYKEFSRAAACAIELLCEQRTVATP